VIVSNSNLKKIDAVYKLLDCGVKASVVILLRIEYELCVA